jgi:hypothetical protein
LNDLLCPEGRLPALTPSERILCEPVHAGDGLLCVWVPGGGMYGLVLPSILEDLVLPDGEAKFLPLLESGVNDLPVAEWLPYDR